MPAQDDNALTAPLTSDLGDDELALVVGGAALRQPLPVRQCQWGLEDWIDAGCPND